jgi:hypothetical protein
LNRTSTIDFEFYPEVYIKKISYYIGNIDELEMKIPLGDYIPIKWKDIDIAQRSIDLNLSSKEYVILIRVEDQGGSIVEDWITFTMDSDRPTVFLHLDGPRDLTEFRFDFSEPMNISSVEIAIDWDVMDLDWIDNETAVCEINDGISAFYLNISGKDIAGNEIDFLNGEVLSDPWLAFFGIINGTVVNKTGQPVQNASIYANGELIANTSDSGYFSVMVALGDVELLISKDGFLNKTIDIDLIGELDLGQITLDEVTLEEEEERTQFPWVVVIMGVLLIIITIYISISAFTRKNGPLSEE